MNPSQIVSLVSVSVLTVVAVIVGIELILVLRELKESLTKINNTAGIVEDTVQKVSQPMIGFISIIEGFRQSGKIVENISRLFGHDRSSSSETIDEHDTN